MDLVVCVFQTGYRNTTLATRETYPGHQKAIQTIIPVESSLIPSSSVKPISVDSQGISGVSSPMRPKKYFVVKYRVSHNGYCTHKRQGKRFTQRMIVRHWRIHFLPFNGDCS